MNNYQKIIHHSRYAKFDSKKNRRETWEETVDRWDDYMRGRFPTFPKYIKPYVMRMDVMPSMRVMQSAGKALDENNIAAYNCSYMAVNTLKSFSEAMLILMYGTGVGYSVERQYINQLPILPENIVHSDEPLIVKDSKSGWAVALNTFIKGIYAGKYMTVDYSLIRPKGATLKTFGGRASGPEPLKNLIDNIVVITKSAQGRKLNSIECHDIMCLIGDTVVSGGTRRSAMLSLSNLSDGRMREAKADNWYLTNSYRANANNSVAYTEKPDIKSFMTEWFSLAKAGTGERGIFNRNNVNMGMERLGRRKHDFGTNPCGEIILRDKQFCNLTEVIIRPEDTEENLLEKVEIATIIGTFQSLLTNFKGLSKEWKYNTEDERLLGVSLTGIFDSEKINWFSNVGSDVQDTLANLRDTAEMVNKDWAESLNIKPSKAITTVKPSGTVSQLVDSASGIHPRHSNYYIRRIRLSDTDPLVSFLEENGFVIEIDKYNTNNRVVSFYMKNNSLITNKNINVIRHLELWLKFKTYYCHHNPSVTISVPEADWMLVGDWVYKNFQSISGLTFLPKDEGMINYEQAPYEEITQEEYEEKIKSQPEIDLKNFKEFEDNTVTTEVACTSGQCDI